MWHPSKLFHPVKGDEWNNFYETTLIHNSSEPINWALLWKAKSTRSLRLISFNSFTFHQKRCNTRKSLGGLYFFYIYNTARPWRALWFVKKWWNYVHVFFSDFSKGLDLINHYVLITELELLGVHICIRNWIGAFLTSRRQPITINDIVSPAVSLYGGTPQGTRFPPLLFALLVNRLLSDWPYRVKVYLTPIFFWSQINKHVL